MSGGDRLDELFFKGEGLTTQGEAFVERINSYRENLLSILGTDANPDLIRNIKKRFNTDPEPARDEDSPEIPWIKSRYEGMPMITSLANMTQIQGDVKKYRSRDLYESFRRSIRIRSFFNKLQRYCCT